MEGRLVPGFDDRFEPAGKAKPGTEPPPEIMADLLHLKGFPLHDRFTVPGLQGYGDTACVSVPASADLPKGWRAVSVRRVFNVLSEGPGRGALDDPAGRGTAMLLFRAFHIAQWRTESRFCGSCGAGNVDGDMHARLCPRCGRKEFPRITPAVIVLITDDSGRILLAHNRKFGPGMYSLLAGFVEAGETPEQAVLRETEEEVGIRVSDIRYIASSPWPFPASLMLGFSARHVAGELRPDGVEIEDAAWYDRPNLPLIPAPGSLSRGLIDYWLKGEADPSSGGGRIWR